LRQKDAIRTFNERLAREWAIETGVIENVYQLERGITLLLIEKGLDAALIPYGASDRPAEEVIRIVQDHQDALEGLFAFVKHDRPLSKAYVRELHQQITAHQTTVLAKDTLGNLVEIELMRGAFKQLPNNPYIPGKGLHEYCPPEHVESEMEQLLAWHAEHEAADVAPEVEAAWLHHRFTQIHPFQDGNGRVARALASLVLIKARYFPLLITRDTRGRYLDALAVADAGNLSPLVALFAQVQKTCFLKALSLSHDVIQERDSIHEVVGAAIDRLLRRQADEESAQRVVLETSAIIEGVAYKKLQEVSQLLTQRLLGVRSAYKASAQRSNETNDFWFKAQIVETARRHGYFADTRTYRAWAQLRIQEERTTSIVFSFHAVGTQFLGILAVSAFVEHRSPRREGEAELPVVEGPYPVSPHAFEFSYLERAEDVKRRFEDWMGETLTLALDQWRRQL
jgi:hypothetical protein